MESVTQRQSILVHITKLLILSNCIVNCTQIIVSSVSSACCFAYSDFVVLLLILLVYLVLCSAYFKPLVVNLALFYHLPYLGASFVQLHQPLPFG